MILQLKSFWSKKDSKIWHIIFFIHSLHEHSHITHIWTNYYQNMPKFMTKIETAVRRQLELCQCRSSKWEWLLKQRVSQCGYSSANVSPALTALNRHWRNAGGTGSTRECDNSDDASTGQHFSVDRSPGHVITHQGVTEMVSKWHYFTNYVTHTQNTYKQQNRLITHTYKQKHTKHPENMHKLKCTTHRTIKTTRQSNRQDSNTTMNPRRFKAPGGSENRQFRTSEFS